MPDVCRVESLSQVHPEWSGYRGLSRRERRRCIALSLFGLTALFLLAFSIGAPAPLPVATPASRALTLFEFKPPAEEPPPPPPVPKDGGARAAPKTKPLDIPKPAPRLAVATAPTILPVKPLVPLPAPSLPLAAPAAGPQDAAKAGGAAGTGTGDGRSGHGTGSGAGDGDGDGAEYAQAEWIERPPRDGIDHLWAFVAPANVSTVFIKMVCKIVPPFKPRHCHILSEQPHIPEFGATAVHLVELSRIRPIAKDGSPTDLPVIIGLTFNR
jgi:hypothetical protein